jgi:ligand-binding sensor domain-containing protein
MRDYDEKVCGMEQAPRRPRTAAEAVRAPRVASRPGEGKLGPRRGRPGLLGLLMVLLLAALLAPRPARAAWQNFQAQDGLASSWVFAMLEAQDGVLWFGTAQGISRFDGVHWTTYRDPLPQGKAVKSVCQGNGDDLWFGTEQDGAVRFDGTNWTSYTHTGGPLPGAQVQVIIKDHTGDIWFGTDNGLARYRFKDNSWTSYRSELVNQDARGLAEDSGGNLWVGTPFGVSRLDSSRTVWTPFRENDGLVSDSILVVVADPTGRVWFGTDLGVSVYRNGTWTTYNDLSGLGHGTVKAIVPDGTGGAWFGGDFGFSRFDGRVWRRATTTDQEPLPVVSAMYRDSSGNLWLATPTSGLYRFDGADWQNFLSDLWKTNAGSCPYLSSSPLRPNVFLGSNCVRGMLEDHRGEIWLTTFDGGASRLDARGQWKTYPNLDVPLSDSLTVVAEDREGALWFGSSDQGVFQLASDRRTLNSYSTSSSAPFTLPSDCVSALLGDADGSMWVGTKAGLVHITRTGISHYLERTTRTAGAQIDGIIEDQAGRHWIRTSRGLYSIDRDDPQPSRWGVQDGLPAEVVNTFLAAESGDVWFGTPGGLAVLHPDSSWEQFHDLSEPGDDEVKVLLETRAGDIWVGTENGAARITGSEVVGRYTKEQLGSNSVRSIMEDASGTIWLGLFEGVVRFNGRNWKKYESVGLVSSQITYMLAERSGRLWFGARSGGVTEHDPDRAAPHTIILTRPEVLTSSRSATFVYSSDDAGADTEYRQSFDGGPVSEWSSGAFSFKISELLDGTHTLRVWSRDWVGNVDPTPAGYTFEVAATPPAAVISAPVFGQAVRGVVGVQGTATGRRLKSLRLIAWPSAAPAGENPDTLSQSSAVVEDTLRVQWDTRVLREGNYNLQVEATDSLGLVGTARVTVTVDNAPPYFEVTAPARVGALDGGEVFTTFSEVHLYFPPRAFAADAVVNVQPSADPPSAGNEFRPLSAGWDIGWDSGDLAKPATLDMGFADTAAVADPGTRAIYIQEGNGPWTRLGGTLSGEGRLSATFERPGRYAVFAAGAPTGVDTSPAPLTLTPRAFSPDGAFAAREVAISFKLAQAGPATVRIFNPAGRLVREVLGGASLGPGVNVVRWDGRDSDGRVVDGGLYLVRVEAKDLAQVKTVMVVRK